MSSSAGRCSGNTPRSFSIFLTAILLSMCSFEIWFSPFRFLSTTLWLVNSVAKSFAFIVNVGKKSAKDDDDDFKIDDDFKDLGFDDLDGGGGFDDDDDF